VGTESRDTSPEEEHMSEEYSEGQYIYWHLASRAEEARYWHKRLQQACRDAESVRTDADPLIQILYALCDEAATEAEDAKLRADVLVEMYKSESLLPALKREEVDRNLQAGVEPVIRQPFLDPED
jgi:hypothetical protein